MLYFKRNILLFLSLVSFQCFRFHTLLFMFYLLFHNIKHYLGVMLKCNCNFNVAILVLMEKARKERKFWILTTHVDFLKKC